MRVQAALLLLALAACATTAPAPLAPVDDGTATLAEIRQIRGRVRHGEGPQVHAEQDARLKANPRDAHALFLKTVAEMPSEPSWQAFKRQSREDPADVWPLFAMSQIYIEWKMFPQAKQTLDQADTVRIDFLPFALERARLQLAEGQDAAARSAFQALRVRADIPEVHAGLGELALRAGELTAARSELALAVKGDPGNLGAQRALADLAAKQGDPQTELGALREVVAMQPRDGEAIFRLAKLEESQGELPAAARDFARAGKLRGIDLETAQHLVALAQKVGSPEALKPALEALARVDKTHAAPELELAQLALTSKDTAAAESHFKEALVREPGQAEATLGLARLYRDTGKKRLAIDAYRSLAARPDAPAEAKAELEPLIADLGLAEAPLTGSVSHINVGFSADLIKFYKKRLRQNPRLKGKLRIAVEVAATGKVEAVTIAEDTVKDELLALHAYVTMERAEFPPAKRAPVFEIELAP